MSASQLAQKDRPTLQIIRDEVAQEEALPLR